MIETCGQSDGMVFKLVTDAHADTVVVGFFKSSGVGQAGDGVLVGCTVHFSDLQDLPRALLLRYQAFTGDAVAEVDLSKPIGTLQPVAPSEFLVVGDVFVECNEDFFDFVAGCVPMVAELEAAFIATGPAFA
jgi:hypothetical protein